MILTQELMNLWNRIIRGKSLNIGELGIKFLGISEIFGKWY